MHQRTNQTRAALAHKGGPAQHRSGMSVSAIDAWFHAAATGLPPGIDRTAILNLQQMAGNRFVARLLTQQSTPSPGRIAGEMPAPAGAAPAKRVTKHRGKWGLRPASLAATPTTSHRCWSHSTHKSALVQRWILKEGKRTQKKENTYEKFPSVQLRALGVTEAEMELAEKYHVKKNAYYSLAEVAKAVKSKLAKANKGVRVKAQVGKKRLTTTDDVIDFYDGQGVDTTSLQDKFVTKKHGPTMDAVLKLVPVTEENLTAGVSTTKGNLADNFVSFINQEHVPDMVRTPSMIGDIGTSMAAANTAPHQGFVSSSKGSIFEQWVAQHVIASAGKIHIAQQGKMSQARQADGYSSAQQTIYDAKFYDAQMAKGTNNNQWFDYQEIVNNGYKGTKGEKVTTICYIFPDIATAQLNTHLKDTHIQVAYPKKGATTLMFV